MRTALILLVGSLLLAACLLLGRLFSGNYPGASYAATVAFIVVWLHMAEKDTKVPLQWNRIAMAMVLLLPLVNRVVLRF